MFKNMYQLKNCPINWAPIWGCNFKTSIGSLLKDDLKEY
jgi:hypothetical protein